MGLIHHIGITCSDIVKSEEFYCKSFGLTKTKEAKVPENFIQQVFGINSSAILVYLKAKNGQLLELFEFPEAKNLKSSMGSISHLALSVGNREEIAEKLRTTGVEVKIFTKDDGRKVYFAVDPDGVMVELKD